ncbi:MAG: hypothetical protein PWQ58_767 [Archaeoglobaceae archaeon]|nr:hypothetical protein [Archaeoglobaceae archaeon]
MKKDRILSAFLLSAILASTALLVYIIITPKQGERFTEFYILGEKGKAADYPTNLLAGEEARVIIGIVNHEYRTVDYMVEIWLVNNSSMLFLDSFCVTLNHTDLSEAWKPQYEVIYNFSIDEPGRYKMYFLLFKNCSTGNFERMKDYYESDFWKIRDAEERKIQSLYLNIFVR